MRLHWERAIICRMRWLVFNESSKRGGESTKCEHNTVQQHRISRPVGTWWGANIVKNAITNRTRSDAADSVWTTQSSTTEYSNKGKSKGGRGTTIFISSGRLSSFSHSFPSAFRTCTRVASGIDSVTSPTPNIGTNGVVSFKTRRFSLSRWTRVKTQPWLLIDRPYG